MTSRNSDSDAASGESKYRYLTKIWREEPMPDNPFAAQKAYCHGYDVYGEILKKATWFEYLYLLFMGERPSSKQALLLEKLAIALGNPGPREASVRAAMNGGVSKTTHASVLMSTLAVGAGQYGGSHELYILLAKWRQLGADYTAWIETANEFGNEDPSDIWLPMEHAPGFDPNGTSCPTPLIQILNELSAAFAGGALSWLKENRENLESRVGYPISITSIAAAAFYDLEMDQHQASMLFLILRLPGAAAHALEQRDVNWRDFPFFADGITLENDPGFINVPNIKGINS